MFLPMVLFTNQPLHDCSESAAEEKQYILKILGTIFVELLDLLSLFLFSLAKCRSLLFLIVVISSVYFTVEHTLNLKDPNTWSRLCRPTQFCLPSTWLLK